MEKRVNYSKLSVQVLVATMNQCEQKGLPELLNLQTDAIIGNQCTLKEPQDCFMQTVFRGKTITWLNFPEKGVGLNRNNALMRATADILIFSDDDMTFVDDYEKIVIGLYEKNPQADVIIFNIKEDIPKRHRTKKAHYTNKCGYGCARITCRRESVMKYGIFFNLNYGGGCCYNHGEDSVFLSDCMRRGLRVLVVPEEIAKLNESRESTWFQGLTGKYYYDKGNLMAALGVRFPLLRFVIKTLSNGLINFEEIRKVKKLYKGYRDFKRNHKINIYKDE